MTQAHSKRKTSSETRELDAEKTQGRDENDPYLYYRDSNAHERLSFYQRFVDSFQDGEVSFKREKYEEAATHYRRALRYGGISRVTGVLSGGEYAGSEWIKEVKQKRAEARKRAKMKDNNDLGKMLAVFSMVGLLGATFIFSSNFTGNVIGNNVNSISNWIGGALFIIGLIGAFAYFKRI